jgi:hypothetical protein
MKIHRAVYLTVLSIIAACALATPAAAQNAAQGSFTLPEAVRWNSATLPAGNYTFTMKSTSMPNLIRIDGPAGGAFIQVAGTSRRHSKRSSELIIERRGRTRFVRELYLADLDLHLHYAAPSVPKEELLAMGPAVTEHVRVSLAGE